MEEMGQLTMPVSITRVEAHHTDGTRATSWSVVQVSAFDGDDGETTSSDRDVDDEPQQNMQLAVAQPRQTTNLVEYVKDIAKTKSIPIYTPCENGGGNDGLSYAHSPRLEQQLRLQDRIQRAPMRAHYYFCLCRPNP